MRTDDNPKRRISKFASDLSSSWSAKNDSSSMSGFTNQWHVLSFPTHFGKKRKTADVKKPNIGQSYSTGTCACKEELLDPSWTDPQILCSQNGASVKGGLGPFGLLVLASKGLKEYTAVFFRIFKAPNKHAVLMCSDQSRSSLNQNNDKTIYGTFLDIDPVHEKLSLRSLIILWWRVSVERERLASHQDISHIDY
ncbi:hypothetical protein FNV43_RR07553 [Rhamnella rubrinervis]|uniref:Glycosyl hydrolase family 32 C-terminal domain-containing protein n=1 Tax=Rhamnella rubrinervis TaxID=2594499 RepID=A0A8K0HG41_9ROSA|nr:hypothetical protein FNV43_RR07553 [Rhamnella rubrinervis]